MNMDDKSNSIEIAFQEIVSRNNLAIDLVEQLMAGYGQGRWSSRRVQRELDIDRVEFWYIKAYYGVGVGGSPDPYYLSEDEKQAELEYQQQVANFALGDGEKPVIKDTNTATIERIRVLIKQPVRRTLLLPLDHDVICALHALNRLDVLSNSEWETHLDKITLLVATNLLGFEASLKMMRALPNRINVSDEKYKTYKTYKTYRDFTKDISERQVKGSIKETLSFTANSYLATNLQDDAELNIDTIYLTDYKVNKTIDSRNFMVNIESLIQLVDENE
jgi:hypothetical protein